MTDEQPLKIVPFKPEDWKAVVAYGVKAGLIRFPLQLEAPPDMSPDLAKAKANQKKMREEVGP